MAEKARRAPDADIDGMLRWQGLELSQARCRPGSARCGSVLGCGASFSEAIAIKARRVRAAREEVRCLAVSPFPPAFRNFFSMVDCVHGLSEPSSMASDPDGALYPLLSWLKTCGATFDGISFKTSTLGGLGAFAARPFPSGEMIASIPKDCVLSSRLARSSALGRACKAAAVEWHIDGPDDDGESVCTDATLLWIYMAVGRKDKRHPFFPYLSSLPSESPDPTSWSTSLRNELAATPVGPALDAARSYVDRVFHRFASKLPEKLGEALVPPGCLASSEELLWARGMCLSRAFPEMLVDGLEGTAHIVPLPPSDGGRTSAPAAAARGGAGERAVVLRQSSDGTESNVESAGTDDIGSANAPGCLLPLFDLLNHCHDQPISWVATPAGAASSVGADAMQSKKGSKGSKGSKGGNSSGIGDSGHGGEGQGGSVAFYTNKALPAGAEASGFPATTPPLSNCCLSFLSSRLSFCSIAPLHSLTISSAFVPLSPLSCRCLPCFRASRFVAVSSLAQIFNNYGCRPNEELLVSHGFCLPDNPHDAVLVSLVTGLSPSATQPNGEEEHGGGGVPMREAFYVRRRESGGVPVELLQALSRASQAFQQAVAEQEGGGQDLSLIHI